MQLSNRLNAIEASPTLGLTALANKLKSEGKDVVGFGAGEPDFDTPDYIKEATIAALKEGKTKYTPVLGVEALRKAVTEFIKRDILLDYNAADVVICSGGKQVLYNIFMSIVNPGDEVIIPGPYWVSYKDMVMLSEGKPVIVNTSFESGFKMTTDQLQSAITAKTRAVIINSPSNPTGVVYSRDELKSFANILEKYPDIWIITDDIYAKLIYDDNEFFNLAMLGEKLRDRVIIADSFSKAFSMTGWRLGYAVTKNPGLVAALEKIQGQSTSNATSFVQYGAIAALKGDLSFVDKMRDAFQERRDFIVKTLSMMPGIKVHNPGGAFYVFPDISGLVQKPRFISLMEKYKEKTSYSKAFSSALLGEKLVAMVPGIAFGYDMGMRISYAISMEQIKKGMERVAEFVDICQG
ncbi:MAG: pyridoxal phosphate-dependent aminotransferase [Spirochaetia bacterium]|nr:pyridoxal phosphate-dependent aminotransferase [Spirochaetia bacterium]